MRDDPHRDITRAQVRVTIEAWVEALLDIVDAYLRTIGYLWLNPDRIFQLLKADRSAPVLIGPGTFLVVSYFAMLGLFSRVDFSQPGFKYKVASSLDALGALNAARSLNIQTALAYVLPAIGLWIAMRYLAHLVLSAFQKPASDELLRKVFGYSIGAFCIWLGFYVLAFQDLVGPVAPTLGYLATIINSVAYLPLVGMLGPLVLLVLRDRPNLKGMLASLIAALAPWVVFGGVVRILTNGSLITDIADIRRVSHSISPNARPVSLAAIAVVMVVWIALYVIRRISSTSKPIDREPWE